MAEIKFATVGKGGTVHGTTDETKTLCGKDVAKLVNQPGATIACKACNTQAKKIETEETNTVAKAETETPAPSADEVLAQVRTDVQTIFDTLGTLTKDDKDKILSLEAQANSELLKISANKRAPLSMQLKAAVAEAKERSTSALVVRHAETVGLESVEGLDEIVENAAQRAAEGIKSEVDAQTTARTLAEAILDGRIRIFNKKGMPDLKGTRQESKDLATAIYKRAFEILHAEGYNSGGKVDPETAEKALKKKVQYQMTGVLPAFLRALDDSPEQAEELFPGVVAELPEGTKISEVLFETYSINPKAEWELAAERRAAKKELTANGEGAEGEGGDEGDEATEDEGTADAPKTPALKLADTLEKVTQSLGKLKADDLSEAEINALRAQLLALTTVTQSVAVMLNTAGKGE
ncbi:MULTISPECIES: hypothetical protein [Streptomyces]|uniref:hypothetical protein n=1 Tax=Streptomyces TaxID=1883 RepID=UPI0016020F26|nr:hypothetical protein [Streptomyces murinus]MBA9050794.1 hypothetical protein [Streptomyces murinus]